MNEIENFYHSRVISNVNINTAQDFNQKRPGVDVDAATQTASEGRSFEDIVSISAEAQERLKADQLKKESQEFDKTVRGSISDRLGGVLLTRPDDADVDISGGIRGVGSDAREFFDKFDIDDNGTVTLREFASVLDRTGVPEGQQKRLIEWFKGAEIEADNTEGITKQEAVRLYKVAQGGPAATFHYFDANGDGTITEKEMIDLGTRRGGTLERILTYLNNVDTNGDGEISLSEYRATVSGSGGSGSGSGGSVKDPESELAALFESYDRDGNGTVTLREFSATLDGLDISDEKREELIAWFKGAELEADNTEGLTKQEVVRLYNVAKGGAAAAFYYYDADGDGIVKEEELIDMVRRNGGDLEELMAHLKRLDADGNGEVTFAEYREGLGGEQPKLDLKALFAEYDLDSNGTVTLSEVEETLDGKNVSDERRRAIINWFKSAEIEADGKKGITTAELKRFIKIEEGGADADFHYYDSNADGVVTKRELADMVRRNGGNLRELMDLFEKIDSDSNNQVVLSEFHDFLDSINNDPDARRIAEARRDAALADRIGNARADAARADRIESARIDAALVDRIESARKDAALDQRIQKTREGVSGKI